MSLELINTLGTVTTVVIVAAAAVAALVQLRHLRAGNQINAMLSIGDKFQGREYRDALYLVNGKLEAAVDDPSFRDYHAAVLLGRTPPDVDPEYVALRRAALLVGNTYEELGILVKNRIVDRTLFINRYCHIVLTVWGQLENLAAFSREVAGYPGLLESFEYLVVLCQDWMQQHPGGTYPKGVRRLQLHNPWPVPPLPATA